MENKNIGILMISPLSCVIAICKGQQMNVIEIITARLPMRTLRRRSERERKYYDKKLLEYTKECSVKASRLFLIHDLDKIILCGPVDTKNMIYNNKFLHDGLHDIETEIVDTSFDSMEGLRHLIIKQHLTYTIVDFHGIHISTRTYVKFMKKYNLDHEGKTDNEMAIEIHKHEIAHEKDIVVGLYIDGIMD